MSQGETMPRALAARGTNGNGEFIPMTAYVEHHTILKDSKSSTYKLALLRVLARIAEGSLGLTRSVNDAYVAVPLGLVAVFWLRQFKPAVKLLRALPTGNPNSSFFRGIFDPSPI